MSTDAPATAASEGPICARCRRNKLKEEQRAAAAAELNEQSDGESGSGDGPASPATTSDKRGRGRNKNNNNNKNKNNNKNNKKSKGKNGRKEKFENKPCKRCAELRAILPEEWNDDLVARTIAAGKPGAYDLWREANGLPDTLAMWKALTKEEKKEFKEEHRRRRRLFDEAVRYRRMEKNLSAPQCGWKTWATEQGYDMSKVKVRKAAHKAFKALPKKKRREYREAYLAAKREYNEVVLGKEPPARKNRQKNNKKNNRRGNKNKDVKSRDDDADDVIGVLSSGWELRKGHRYVIRTPFKRYVQDIRGGSDEYENEGILHRDARESWDNLPTADRQKYFQAYHLELAELAVRFPEQYAQHMAVEASRVGGGNGGKGRKRASSGGGGGDYSGSESPPAYASAATSDVSMSSGVLVGTTLSSSSSASASGSDSYSGVGSGSGSSDRLL